MKPEDLTIIFVGKQPDNKGTIQGYNIHIDTTQHLVHKLRG